MIKVLNPGLYTTIQDLGRNKSRNLGIPVSGVMDSYSAKLANLLVGNSDDKALMEITLQGPALQFLDDITIAITAADLSPEHNKSPIELNQSVQMKKGDILQFGKRKKGVRCYLAVLGGLDTEIVFDSRSYFKGITSKELVQKGDELPFGKFESSSFSTIELEIPQIKNELIVTKGPEFGLLTKSQQEKLQNSTFTIGLNNRMAYQVEKQFQNDLPSILSSAVQPGTIQLTHSGKLMILMRDCQTTGGYPRILQLTEEAICMLSQKMKGEKVSFEIW